MKKRFLLLSSILSFSLPVLSASCNIDKEELNNELIEKIGYSLDDVIKALENTKKVNTIEKDILNLKNSSLNEINEKIEKIIKNIKSIEEKIDAKKIEKEEQDKKDKEQKEIEKIIYKNRNKKTCWYLFKITFTRVFIRWINDKSKFWFCKQYFRSKEKIWW